MGDADASDVASQLEGRYRLDLRSLKSRVVLVLIGLMTILFAIALVFDFGVWRVGHLRSHEPLPEFTGHLAQAILFGLFTTSLWFRARLSSRKWPWRVGAVVSGASALVMLLAAGAYLYMLMTPGQ
jgi:multisubunit Na+/H+ antiporter MnhB subunit